MLETYGENGFFNFASGNVNFGEATLDNSQAVFQTVIHTVTSDSALLLLGINKYSKKLKTCFHIKVYLQIFKEELFLINT